MKQILSYNIHDVLKFKIVRSRRHFIMKGLNNPFSFFETDEDINTPDITLNIGKFNPANNNRYVVDHKYYIKENYFYCKDSGGKAKWELEIFGFEKGNTVINFDGKFPGPRFLISDLIAQEMLLMPLIMYKLSKKGYYLVHAGGVSKDNCAYIFAGRGGSSKTELVMDFVKSGFDYLGDDWVIIHKNGVLAFPKHFHAFTFSLKSGHLPTENSSTIVDKICYINYLRKNLNHDIKGFKISELSVLKALFFIVKTNKKTGSKKSMSSKGSISRLITNNQIELIASPSIMSERYGRYYNYMLAYSFVFPSSEIAKDRGKYESNLKGNLAGSSYYMIKMPLRYDFKDIHRMIEESVYSGRRK